MKLKLIVLLSYFSTILLSQQINQEKVNGYKAIWFELNQKYKYGDKYSGALGTYTAKHTPIAIYAEAVKKTFFVYGGTRSAGERHLLCMIGQFDHTSELVSKPTIVHDKEGVDDPHDNPSLMLDKNGYIYVFISGRGKKRPGYKYRSMKPYDISAFERLSEEEMTYPQPWFIHQGSFHFFTKYTGQRQLYFETSFDGQTWTADRLLAAIPVEKGEKSGHYQTSASFKDSIVGTFFNRHPNGIVNKRTDLYYLQTADFGLTWTNPKGGEIEIPVEDRNSPSKVIDYASKSKNIYLKDMGFDLQGRPACLYIRSNGYEPGPESEPYEWCISKWNGDEWVTSVVATSDHNYDMGSLYINDDKWLVVAPLGKGPQSWGVGGEISIWESNDWGNTWRKKMDVTQNSKYSHSYIRRPINHKAPFSFFWADGHSHEFSPSNLYFGDFEGNVWKLPYDMETDYTKPKKVE